MSKNISSEISFLMKTAIDINKKVGGVKAYGIFLIYSDAEKKAKDKFSVLKDEISKKIHIIRNVL